MLRRSRLSRRKPLTPKSSLRRTAMKAGRRQKRADPDRPLASWCEAAVLGTCTGRAAHRHHKRGRSADGSRDGFDDTLDVCHACHGWIHAHPREAYVQGWMVKRTATEGGG